MKKAVVVTGSNGGIGTAICKKLVDEGYMVIGVDLGSDKNQLPEYLSLDLDCLVVDVSYRKAKLLELHKVVQEYQLIGLVNNAAIQILGGVNDLDVQQFSKSFNVNVLAAFVLSQALFKILKTCNGSIVNIGSIHANLTKKGFLAYSTSKSALNGLTKALSLEAGGKVRVNGISPAAINTPMLKDGLEGITDVVEVLSKYHPTDCIGEPNEIAQLVVFLVKKELPFLNGSLISLDGGIGNVLHDPL